MAFVEHNFFARSLGEQVSLLSTVASLGPHSRSAFQAERSKDTVSMLQSFFQCLRATFDKHSFFARPIGEQVSLFSTVASLPRFGKPSDYELRL